MKKHKKIKYWKKEEIKELRILVDNFSNKELAKKFNTKSVNLEQILKYYNIKRTPKSPEQRFWKKVDKKEEDECWEWGKSSARKRYRSMSIMGKTTDVHRFSWIIHYGKIPKGMYVCHRCDNPPCVNPKHLWLGTNTDNLRDMYKKGRGRNGELSNFNKLTEKEVLEIRRMYKEDNMAEWKIAKIYNITQPNVSCIVNRKTWKHI